MNNSLVPKNNSFIDKVKEWIQEKCKNILKYNPGLTNLVQKKWKDILRSNQGFTNLVPIDLGGNGRMFEIENKAGKKYLFKPAESKSGLVEPFRADIQEAVYILQQRVNPKGAISCYTTIIDGMYGAVQEKIDTNNDFNILNWQLYGGEIPQYIVDGILQEYVIDWTCANFDANGSHFLRDNKENIRCCDKEQAFRYLFDERSQTPNLDYNPNESYGEIEPIYNTIIKRYISGELEGIDFNTIYIALDRLDSISDEEYISYFRSYIDKLAGNSAKLYIDKILERKHNARNHIEEFIKDIIEMRNQAKENIEITNLDEASSEYESLPIGEAVRQEEAPFWRFEPIEIDNPITDEDIARRTLTLHNNLAKYGITKEEWAEIEKYAGSGYFLPTTLLHKVDLSELSIPNKANTSIDFELLEPQKVIDFYCKIYSAMCKFGKRYNKSLHIARVGSSLFYEEMNETGKTESLLSYSKVGYQFDFAEGKNGVVLSNALLKAGTPCIDFTQFEEESPESEVLIPPFLSIAYSDKASLNGGYEQYDTYIFGNMPKKLSDEEREKMKVLEQSVVNSNVAYKYYKNWFDWYHNGMSGQMSATLKEEFFEWQEKFKEYLQFRFREIEYEISYPQLKSTDFLQWGIERGKSSIEKFKSILKNVSNIFDKNEKDR